MWGITCPQVPSESVTTLVMMVVPSQPVWKRMTELAVETLSLLAACFVKAIPAGIRQSITDSQTPHPHFTNFGVVIEQLLCQEMDQP